jgi:hypothetical protein
MSFVSATFTKLLFISYTSHINRKGLKVIWFSLPQRFRIDDKVIVPINNGLAYFIVYSKFPHFQVHDEILFVTSNTFSEISDYLFS